MFSSCCGCINKKPLEKSSLDEEQDICDIPKNGVVSSEDVIKVGSDGDDVENLKKNTENQEEIKSSNDVKDISEEKLKFDEKTEPEHDTEEEREISEEDERKILKRLKSDASNTTIEESILIQQRTTDDENGFHLKNNNIVPKHHESIDNCQNDDTNTLNSRGSDIVDEVARSCLSRRSSSKSSIKKRVNYNDSTEVIPASDLTSINDDDEVFSDSIPPKLPRGDMCTPYPKKRGSMPGLVALPDWFSLEDYREEGGALEPPVTPIGRDELALKRHRFFSDLLTAAQAAAEHRVRFDPLGPNVAADDDDDNEEDCDPNLKPSATAELEHLIVRLERIVDRLERSVSARELAITNQTFDAVIATANQSVQVLADCNLYLNSSLDPDLPLPPPPPPLPPLELTIEEELQQQQQQPQQPSSILADLSTKLEQRIVNLETNLNHIPLEQKFSIEELDLIPTVISQIHLDNNKLIEETETPPPTPIPIDMSVNGYEDIVNGSLAKFINLSNKIGGDVAQQVALVKKAFDAQMQYIILATQSAQPAADRQNQLLQPTSQQISAVQDFREKHRTSPLFNHLSAISESIPALGWVCVTPTPGPYVKEMNDAGQFYTNRVLKDWKEKDTTHVEWARSWIQTLTELQQYIKQYHTTGLVWSGKAVAAGGCPPPPPPSGLPPPPPPLSDDFFLQAAGGETDERSALFAEINRGEDITKNLKKVTSEMQTHKNPTLRSGPAPFKAPVTQAVKAPAAPQGKPTTFPDKAPSFTRDGKKWLIEYQKSNSDLLIENAEMNNVAYMFRCQDSTLTVKGKINSIVIDSCKKCSILFDSLVSSIEFVNCQSVQMQVLAKVPTISIDKTDGCQMYLSDQSLGVEIISSKSSEMNVLIPKGNGDYIEQPIPEQFKTTIKGKSLSTICVESLG